MNNLHDVLEICLQELKNGSDLETVLARYPNFATELRPVLKASVSARTMKASVATPSIEVVRRGRAKLLQRASEMREQKTASRKRVIPIFQRLAIALSLTTIFLASGTGLVGASSAALPGENLYPVKRTWEDVRLFFVFDPQAHDALKNEFENERLQEVNDLLGEGRDESIQFAGVFKHVNGVAYVSGVTVITPDNVQVPADGAAVLITGQTNVQGAVEIESLNLLPQGSIVPLGKPVEGENESGSSSNNGGSSGKDNHGGSNDGGNDGGGDN